MSERYSEERNTDCLLIKKNVYQKFDYVLIRSIGTKIAQKKLSGTFCNGYPKCGGQDCHLVVGEHGTLYTEPLEN